MRCSVCNTMNIDGSWFSHICGAPIVPTHHYWMTPQGNASDDCDEFEYIDNEPNPKEQTARHDHKVLMDKRRLDKTSSTDWGALLGAFTGGVIVCGVAAALFAMDDD